MRRRYISSSREEQELLSARKKVLLPYIWNFLEDELTYNVLEKDIAVINLYFGASTVQGNISI